jgi:chemotaxis protein methyltransferase CheR
MEAQFIVCRNVLIYFGEDLQARVVRLFARSLQRGGYLLLGRAESLPAADESSFQHMNIASLYRRSAGGAHV